MAKGPRVCKLLDEESCAGNWSSGRYTSSSSRGGWVRPFSSATAADSQQLAAGWDQLLATGVVVNSLPRDKTAAASSATIRIQGRRQYFGDDMRNDDHTGARNNRAKVSLVIPRWRCWCRRWSRRWGASWLCPQSPAGAEESWESQEAQHQETKDQELSGEDRNLSRLLGSRHSVRLARCCQSTLGCLLPPHVQLARAAQNVPIQGQSSASSPHNPTHI